MKKIICILFFSFFILSCSAQKIDSEIVYFLPSTVRVQLLEKLKTIKEPEKVSFILGNDEAGNYVLYLNNYILKESEFWIKNTNRVVFLEDKYYPLVFESDEFFSYPESKKSIIEKMNKEEGIKKMTTIRENTFSIKFKINGEIIR